MSKFDDFKKAKADASRAQGWYSMAGAVYYGGTSGRGELGSVVSATASFTIYYQHSDGSKNYHESPDALNFALAKVLKRRHRDLIEEAIRDLVQAAKAAAEEAVAEHAALMKEAGLSESDGPQSDVAAAAGGLTQVAIER